MAKYVCDYAQVVAAGEKMIEAASELSTATTSYVSNIESDLNGWNGSAKTNFSAQCKGQTDIATEKATYMNEFGEFIKSCAQKIQELDESLASIQI